MNLSTKASKVEDLPGSAAPPGCGAAGRRSARDCGRPDAGPPATRSRVCSGAAWATVPGPSAAGRSLSARPAARRSCRPPAPGPASMRNRPSLPRASANALAVSVPTLLELGLPPARAIRLGMFGPRSRAPTHKRTRVDDSVCCATGSSCDGVCACALCLCMCVYQSSKVCTIQRSCNANSVTAMCASVAGAEGEKETS